MTLQAQWRLSQFREGRHVPTSSLVLQQTLPTGKYDQLGTRPSDGLGAGAYTTSLAVHSQYYFWMPNGRILRTRLNVAYALSDSVDVADTSVYGTSEGFRGRADPGNTFSIYSAWEYSVTRNWVLALDAFYQHDASTRIRGETQGVPFSVDSGSELALRPGARDRVQLHQPDRRNRRCALVRRRPQHQRERHASRRNQHGLLSRLKPDPQSCERWHNAPVNKARGFILQASYRVSNRPDGARVPVIQIYGRLEDGGTFLVRDDRQRPHFYVRAADAQRARTMRMPAAQLDRQSHVRRRASRANRSRGADRTCRRCATDCMPRASIRSKPTCASRCAT